MDIDGNLLYEKAEIQLLSFLSLSGFIGDRWGISCSSFSEELFIGVVPKVADETSGPSIIYQSGSNTKSAIELDLSVEAANVWAVISTFGPPSSAASGASTPYEFTQGFLSALSGEKLAGLVSKAIDYLEG